jgi:hypothetical protein
MRTDFVGISSPVLDDDQGLLLGIDDLTIVQFIPKLRVEALTIAFGLRMIALTADV